MKSSRIIDYAVIVDSPIACTLTEAEMRDRRRTLLSLVRATCRGITPLELGYQYRFEGTPEILAHLNRLVDLERQCCPFLTFTITVESNHQSICLEVIGPAEAKPIIADFLGS